MPSVSDVQQIQAALGDLNALAQSELVTLWRLLVDRDPVFIRDALADGVPAIVALHSAAAADVTAVWFDDLAVAQGATATAVAARIPVEQAETSARWAAGALWTPGAGSPLLRLQGSVQRMIYQASRDTVVGSTGVTTRWARYASATACPFCRMVATRGAVYHSAGSASGVVGRALTTGAQRRGVMPMDQGTDIRRGGMRRRDAGQSFGDRFHDHCRCMAVPVHAGDSYEPPSYVEQWTEQYNKARDAANSGEAHAILSAWRESLK